MLGAQNPTATPYEPQFRTVVERISQKLNELSIRIAPITCPTTESQTKSSSGGSEILDSLAKIEDYIDSINRSITL